MPELLGLLPVTHAFNKWFITYVSLLPLTFSFSLAPISFSKDVLSEKTASTKVNFKGQDGKFAHGKKDFDGLFSFIDSGAGEIGSTNYECKRWTIVEKRMVQGLCESLLYRGSALLHRAASNDKVQLRRAAILPVTTKISTIFDAVAITTNNSITIADEFFNCSPNSQMDILLHELVHAADPAEEVAYSKDWVDFAEPIISKARFQAAIDDSSGHLWNSQAKDHQWPSHFGCKNLTEALAEYLVADMNKEHSIGDDCFRERITAKFFSMDANELAFLSHYNMGCKSYSKGKYDDAIKQFELCTELRPLVAMPFAYISACFVRQGKYQGSLQQSEHALNMLNSLGVTIRDENILFILRLRVIAYVRMGDIENAINTLDELFRREPRNMDFISDLHERSYFYEKQGKFYAAAQDLKAMTKVPDTFDKLVASGVDYQYILECLNQRIDKSDKPFLYLQTLGQVLEFLGDNESDSGIKKEYYQRALGVYDKSLDAPDCVQTKALFHCAQVSLKLGNYSEMPLLFNQMNDSIDKEILQLGFLEKIGNSDAAHYNYRCLKSKMQITSPGSPFRTFPLISKQ